MRLTSALLGYGYGDDEPGGDNREFRSRAGGWQPDKTHSGRADSSAIEARRGWVYIAQMARTSAYIVHNGVLSAIPEPQSSRSPGPGKSR